jgi:hypothetical protein
VSIEGIGTQPVRTDGRTSVVGRSPTRTELVPPSGASAAAQVEDRNGTDVRRLEFVPVGVGRPSGDGRDEPTGSGTARTSDPGASPAPDPRPPSRPAIADEPRWSLWGDVEA